MWGAVRAIAVIGFTSVRLATFREELQFEFDRAYQMINNMVQGQHNLD